MTEPRTVTRWVTPEGAPLRLVHLTHTSRNQDGWHLILTSAASGFTLLDVHFGRTCSDADLAPWLAAAHAVPVLPTTRRSHP